MYFVYMYAYVCTGMSACMSQCVCMYVSMCLCVCVCDCLYFCIYIHICENIGRKQAVNFTGCCRDDGSLSVATNSSLFIEIYCLSVISCFLLICGRN